MIPIADQIKCARHELKFRECFYPKYVRAKRMDQEFADTEIARMHAILETLLAVERQADDGK